MKTLKGSRTEHNLMAAFAGESQARNRYTFYAGSPRRKGTRDRLQLPRDGGAREDARERYFELLEGWTWRSRRGTEQDRSTEVNLEAAAPGARGVDEHLPTFGKIAEEEGFAAPAAIFRRVAEVEVEHEKRYLRLLGHVKNGTLYKRRSRSGGSARNAAGSTRDEAPERCPTCAHPQGCSSPSRRTTDHKGRAATPLRRDCRPSSLRGSPRLLRVRVLEAAFSFAIASRPASYADLITDRSSSMNPPPSASRRRSMLGLLLQILPSRRSAPASRRRRGL